MVRLRTANVHYRTLAHKRPEKRGKYCLSDSKKSNIRFAGANISNTFTSKYTVQWSVKEKY